MSNETTKQTTKQDKVFGLVITKGEKQISKQVVMDNFALGNDNSNNLILPDWESFPHHLLFTREGEGTVLHFTDEMTGEIRKGNSTISLTDIKEHGFARQAGREFVIPVTGKTGWVQIRDLVFIFGYSDFTESKARAVQPIPSARAATVKAEEDGDDRGYLMVLLGVFVLHMLFFIGALNYVPPPANKMQFVIPQDAKTVLKVKEEVTEASTEAPSDALDSGGTGGGGGGDKGKGAGPGADFGSKGMLAIIGSQGGAGNFGDWAESGGSSIDGMAGAFGGITLGTQGSAYGGAGGGGLGPGGGLNALLAAGGGGGGPAGSGENLRRGGRVQASMPGLSGAGSGGASRKPNDIYKVVSRIVGAVKAKYEARLRTNPNLQGKISVRFSIDQNGSVGSASISSNSTGDPSLGSEIVALIKRLNFGKTDKAGTTNVEYPFNFSKEQ